MPPEIQQPITPYGTNQLKHHEITERIIGIFYEVYNTLGYGFLERVYQNALELRLKKAGFSVTTQQPIHVYFDNQIIGEYFADLVVENKVILELKAARQLTTEHQAQLLHYLRATDYEVGLLLNFGPSPEVVRKLYDNCQKPHHLSANPIESTKSTPI